MAKTLGTPWQKLGHEVPASELEGVDLYWRASNYLSVGQIYLRSNPLMRPDFVDEKTGEVRDFGRPDVKHRLVGHWGTTPGLNFLIGHINRFIADHGQNTVIIMDDMAVCSELYLPAEPILYHATPELIQSFITWAEKDDMETWLQEYYKLCCAVLKQGGTLPNVEALTDLMKNYDQIPLGDLVKRYQEQRWFVPYSRPAR